MRIFIAFYVFILFVIKCSVYADFGSDGATVGAAKEVNVPTTEPTTSQPTGFKAPSVPQDSDLNIPLVDYSAAPVKLPAQQNSHADLASRYASRQRSQQEILASETTMAMNSVAYIFVTFVALVVVIIGIYLYKR